MLKICVLLLLLIQHEQFSEPELVFHLVGEQLQFIDGQLFYFLDVDAVEVAL